MRLGRGLRPWMFASLTWLVVSTLAATNQIVMQRVSGRSWSLPEIVFSGNGALLGVAALTPFAFAASRRWPLGAPDLRRHAIYHVLLSLVFALAVSTLYQGVLAGLFNPEATGGAPMSLQLVRHLAVDVLRWTTSSLVPLVAIYAANVAADHAIRYFVEARERDVQVARLAEQLANARVATLQSQLNPHFLFNALNTIAVRARDGDGTGTARMVEQLSDVLRRTIDRHQTHEVTVEEELSLVREYLAIEQARFSDRLVPSFEIDNAILSSAIPSFALQHLVENAIRHGISAGSSSGRVGVSVRRDGDTLEASVSDDGPGIDESRARAMGHGLDNTRQRLAALYGAGASLTIAASPLGGTIARLRVPLRELALEVGVA